MPETGDERISNAFHISGKLWNVFCVKLVGWLEWVANAQEVGHLSLKSGLWGERKVDENVEKLYDF